MSTLTLDAEALVAELKAGVAALLRPDTRLLGIWSGGAWLAERLAAEGVGQGPHGVISSTLHRDDFSQRGMGSTTDPTRIPFAVDGAHILLVDDVLHTGRTIRAVLNELFDYGRPASVHLAVLVDRGGRELPVAAACSAAKVVLPATQRLRLMKADDGTLTFHLEERTGGGR